MADLLLLSKRDYPNLEQLLSGQDANLLIKGKVLDESDEAVTLKIKSVRVQSKSKFSTQEVVQQLAKNRQKMADTSFRP